MRKKKFIRSFFVVLVIVGAIFAFNNPTVRDRLITTFHLYGGSVKGINTQRADDITTQLNSDINHQIDQAKNQALNIRVSDILGFFNRTQKIGNDFKSMQNYVKTQVGNIHPASKSASNK